MPNGTLVNFAAGETSPLSRGRFELEWFKASCEKLLNWIPLVTGPARYRPGFRHMALTRGGAVARIITFQLPTINDRKSGWGQVAMSLHDLDRARKKNRLALLVILPAAIAVSSIAGWWLAGRALRPIDHVINTARRIRQQPGRTPEDGHLLAGEKELLLEIRHGVHESQDELLVPVVPHEHRQ